MYVTSETSTFEVTEDSIINTVTQSEELDTTLVNLVGSINTSIAETYATIDGLDTVANDLDTLEAEVAAIDLSPYVTSSQLTQTESDFTVAISKSGGANSIKNSIGYANTDFWDTVNGDYIDSVTNNDLINLGLGSGFYFAPTTVDRELSQDIKVVPDEVFTLSWIINKTNTTGTLDSGAVWIKVVEGAVELDSVKYDTDYSTSGFSEQTFSFTPTTNEVTIQIIANQDAEAIVTGLMLHIGAVALQWTPAHGEIYNSNIRMDINGIRVSRLVNGIEMGYTLITPEEFAGYYDGVKIFSLQEDETISKKFKAEDEISMGDIKVLTISTVDSKGWAFVPTV